ncbi:hypothetical protein vseg_000982 [Gypsophila vaccaria]
MLFPHSLAAVPKCWFHSLHPTKTEKSEDIAIEFITQYRDNENTQVSMRTLETLTQTDNEGFSEYLVRWKLVSSQIAKRPSEDEPVLKFIKNMRPIYQVQLRYSNIQDFKQLTRVGTLMEDDIRAGIMTKFVGRGYQGSTSHSAPKHEEANFISALDTLTPSSSFGPKKKREFAPLYMTHTEAFNRLVEKGLLKLIGPTADSPVENRSKWWDENAYCQFHRGKGHDNKKCLRLKHVIQDIIDAGDLPRPTKGGQPSNQNNQLSSHAIFVGTLPIIDCSHLIASNDSDICGIWHSDEEDEWPAKANTWPEVENLQKAPYSALSHQYGKKKSNNRSRNRNNNNNKNNHNNKNGQTDEDVTHLTRSG